MTLIEQEKITLPSFGAKGDPVRPLIDRYKELGIPVSRFTVSHIRHGERNGNVIRRRERAAEILRSKSTAVKDHFLLEYTVKGLFRRDKRRVKPFVFVPRGFIGRVASELKLHPRTLERLLRGLRVELILEEPSLDASFLANFVGVVGAYFLALPPKNQQSAESVARLRNNWDRVTVGSFYRSLRQEPTDTNANWAPFEVEPLREYLGHRINMRSPLSPVDRMVLEATGRPGEDARIAESLTERTGLFVDTDLITAWRGVLISPPALTNGV